MRLSIKILMSGVILLLLSSCGGSGGGSSNQPPAADAGNNLSITVSTSATLDGSNSSDPDEDTLTFHWEVISQPDGSSAEPANPESATSLFTPDRVGSYVLQLTVSDGDKTHSDQMTVTATAVPPVARTSDDATIEIGGNVTLDGSDSSDPDEAALTYIWTIQSKPDASSAAIEDNSLASFPFTPDVVGTYIFRLVVDNGQIQSTAETVTIVCTSVNVPPVAVVGNSLSFLNNETATISGSDSYDSDGDALTYRWSISAKPFGSLVALANTAAETTTLNYDMVGTYKVQLIVNDGKNQSLPVQLTVEIGKEIDLYIIPLGSQVSEEDLCTFKDYVWIGNQRWLFNRCTVFSMEGNLVKVVIVNHGENSYHINEIWMRHSFPVENLRYELDAAKADLAAHSSTFLTIRLNKFYEIRRTTAVAHFSENGKEASGTFTVLKDIWN